MIVSRVRVVLVEFSMELPKSAVVRAVLGPALKAFVMCSLMRSRDATMHRPMLGMITGVTPVVSLITVVGESWQDWKGDQRHHCRQKKLPRDHWSSFHAV